MSKLSIAAEVFGAGVTPGEKSVQTAYEMMVGQSFSQAEFLSEVERVNVVNIVNDLYNITRGAIDIGTTREADERALAMTSIINMFLDGGTRFSNSLVDWIGYQERIDRYGYKSGGRALMIGSISPLSSRAFEVLAENVYGADSSYVVDIAASKVKTLHSNFVYASGTDLPFAADSMDVVHTNRLLHMIEDPSHPKRDFNELMDSLLSEIGRVLASGGQLLMDEKVPETREYERTRWRKRAGAVKLGRLMRSRLQELGFEKIKIDPYMGPVTSDFMFDPDRDLSKQQMKQLNHTITVYARKK